MILRFNIMKQQIQSVRGFIYLFTSLYKKKSVYRVTDTFTVQKSYSHEVTVTLQEPPDL